MAQQSISSVVSTGRYAATDSNFTELYASLASANAAIAAIGTGGAWTTYTPTVTSGSGAFTAVSASGASKTNGKSVNIRISITITTNGTAATSVIATLPVAALAGVTQSITGSRANNIGLTGIIDPATNNITMTNMDSTYPGADGQQLILSGTYEAA